MIKQGPSGPFFVDFVTPEIGWSLEGPVSGPKTQWQLRLTETQDGGKTWHPVGTVTQHGETTISFVTAHAGWIIDGNRLLHTTDGGRHWAAVNMAGVNPMAVTQTGQAVYVTTGNEGVLKSIDGGNHWITIVP
nr:YCF48-related protein [Sulfobacillus harzensis]